MFNKKNKNHTIKQAILSNCGNIIGQETTLKGNLETTGNIRIEGNFIGDIYTKAKLVLGIAARVEGNIIAQKVEVAGKVQGVVQATELLTLNPTAIIKGDIITNKLLIEVGAKFNGKCIMNSQHEEQKGFEKKKIPKQEDEALKLEAEKLINFHEKAQS